MIAEKSWVTATPGVCGGEPCIRNTRHTISGLVEWKQLGLTDERAFWNTTPIFRWPTCKSHGNITQIIATKSTKLSAKTRRYKRMASLYADENGSYRLVEALRLLGHDVLTAHEAGQANQRIPDAAVLAYATADGRSLLTNNRRDFRKLHIQSSAHGGIIAFTKDDDAAARIDHAIQDHYPISGKFIQVYRPSTP